MNDNDIIISNQFIIKKKHILKNFEVYKVPTNISCSISFECMHNHRYTGAGVMLLRKYYINALKKTEFHCGLHII